MAYAQLNYTRTASLAAHSFASQDAADNAKSVYEQAKAQIALDAATIEQRQAQLAASQVNLGYTDIISPVDGTVVSRNVTMGQTVAASFQTPTLFLIATDLTKMQVDTNVSESDIGAIKEGNAARFTVDAFPNRMFQGAVAQVRQSPQTVQNVVTYDVVVGVDNTDLALKPGMTATAQIIIAERDDVLRVPDQALRFTPGRYRRIGVAPAPATGPPQAGFGCCATASRRKSRSFAGSTTTPTPRSRGATCSPAIRSSSASSARARRAARCPCRGCSPVGSRCRNPSSGSRTSRAPTASATSRCARSTA